MALSASKVLTFSLSTIVGDGLRKPASSSSSLSFSLSPLNLPKIGGTRNFSVHASTGAAPLTGVIFEPFEEVKKDVLAVPIAPQVSLARQMYEDECEAAINEQIK